MTTGSPSGGWCVNNFSGPTRQLTVIGDSIQLGQHNKRPNEHASCSNAPQSVPHASCFTEIQLSAPMQQLKPRYSQQRIMNTTYKNA